MKLLLILAIAALCVWFWSRRPAARAGQTRSAKPAPPAAAEPTEMVRCAACGVHLPRNEALEGPQGLYCSPQHRQQAGA